MYKDKHLQWIVRSSGCGSFLSQLKESRELPDSFFADDFSLPDANLMKDMEKASLKIINMLRSNKIVCIFGHDDIDGITSTFIVYDYLKKCGYKKLIPYIPNRFIDHHGIQDSFINFAVQHKIDLLLTVDGCSSSHDGINKLKENGTEVIITDHHLVPETLPDAYAVVNPKQQDCSFPYNMLAGVGVAYFLILSLSKLTGIAPAKSYKTWTALGTIADRVPLNGLNRIIVKEVFLNFNELQDDTIQFLSKDWLIDSSKRKADFLHYLIKLFSNGRDSDGKHTAFEFLIADYPEKQRYYNIMKAQFQEYEQKIITLNAYLEQLTIPEEAKYYFYFDVENNIAPDLLGMAASQIAQKYRIAAFFLQRRNNDLVCEARCNDNLNLIEIFNLIKLLFTQYGGHKKAAGFSAPYQHLEQISEALADYFRNNRIEDSVKNTIFIDAVLDYSELSDSLFCESSVLLPFGQENPEPVILIKNFRRDNFSNKIYCPNEMPRVCNAVFSLGYDSLYFVDFQ